MSIANATITLHLKISLQGNSIFLPGLVVEIEQNLVNGNRIRRVDLPVDLNFASNTWNA